MRALVISIVLLAALGIVHDASAQGGIPRIPKKNVPAIQDPRVDSTYYVIPPADSARMYDSIMKLRREEVKAREKIWASNAPQDGLLTLSISTSFLNRWRAPEISQYFAERANRADPIADRDEYTPLDRYLTFGAQFHLTPSWGLFFEYDLMTRYYNTEIDRDSIKGVPAGEQQLDLTMHTFLFGPEISLYRSHLLRLRVNGGIGAAYVRTYDYEAASNKSRSGSAVWLAASFDIAGDLRVLNWASFTLDLFSRSISTPPVKSGDQDLSTGFGWHTQPFTIAPRASGVVFGFAIGGVFYIP